MGTCGLSRGAQGGQPIVRFGAEIFSLDAKTFERCTLGYLVRRLLRESHARAGCPLEPGMGTLGRARPYRVHQLRPANLAGRPAVQLIFICSSPWTSCAQRRATAASNSCGTLPAQRSPVGCRSTEPGL